MLFLFHLYLLLFVFLLFISLISALIFIVFFCLLTLEFAVYLVPFGVKLECLFEIFFASRGKTVLLRTYLLELLLLGSIHFGFARILQFWASSWLS